MGTFLMLGGQIMKPLTYAFRGVGSPSPRSATIQTTLYDLIDAISAEVRPDEEALVTATAVHLLRSRKPDLPDLLISG
jgi:hypothetical protein